MKQQLRWLMAAALATIPSHAAAQARPSLAATIEQYVDDARTSGDFHGAILVSRDGEVIYEGSAGFANYEWAVPNTEDTRFRVGSITKQFTAALVLQEVERGSLRLDDTISEYLPYYRRDTGEQVTIRQLLNHTSGIADLPRDFSAKHERNAYQRREFVELFCSGDLQFPPGSRFSYSNAGYYLLGAILEASSGQPYGELLRSRIIEPAGLEDTFYVEDALVLERTASGYNRKSETQPELTHAALIDPTVPFSMAGVYSTVEDLYEWDRALYTDILLSDSMRSAMYTPSDGERYSNGWFVYTIEVPERGQAVPVTMHQGSINGFSGVIFRNLESRTLVVILNNLRSNGSEWKMGEDLLKILAGNPSG